jgi:hypothetical protein
MTDPELHESLLSYIRTAPAPTASSLIDDYMRANQGVDQGAVRRAMMGLMSAGRILVGAGPQWAITVKS